MTSQDNVSFAAAETREPQLEWFAQVLAFLLEKGDVVALRGDLGAGKTTFARAAIRALAADPAHEVPSPTFTLVQTYATEPVPIAHLDLYRLSAPEELDELGLDHLTSAGAVLIEWPERAEDRLPPDRLEIALAEPAAEGADREATRDVTLTGFGAWAPRLGRLLAMGDVINAAAMDKPATRITRLAGDASTRRYGRIVAPTGERALIMNWPPAPDGSPLADGRPYSQVARLAEDTRSFIAIAQALKRAGLSTPLVHAADIGEGFIVLEDLGSLDYAAALAKGFSQKDLWAAAVDVLGGLRSLPADTDLAVGNGEVHRLPELTAEILQNECTLLIDWLWPSLHGQPASDGVRAEFTRVWAPLIEAMTSAPKGWLLRDFHSPNLIYLPDRSGPAQVGIIDFQDALQGSPAYDLVSLLQDARLDVPARLEAELLGSYCQRVAAGEKDFDEMAFRNVYAMFGAQRANKILGIFARLAKRDGKPGYLRHMPRIWGYLDRNLQHPGLMELARWYEESFPRKTRARPLAA